ncbi:poly A polymerase C-terminal region-like protein [Basidiobolus meristosporus CBS 931.73]|uniref:Poly A polymerase C-terminal region-like protein n=1 Tax=Basidiobolus meristosporus CBS 931.73 TaxID=1314790 RepID=A0A1Y1Z576_9FUNG|nr:poly A polymerase C-terminal region-like protein [Basidiobolus meristosporus CBS 931.73]|eukprot:ORY05438.1 poly A polymerase C-terminal region-like protein [Basidiobolus meristosporus CBS 931.73]
MTGHQFAKHLNTYLLSKGVPQSQLAKIESNPKQSQHLETCTTKLFDTELDFVNLRNEVYDADSRIPVQITFGTPEQDSYRRDITINALFFNIHNRQVEDYTQMGLTDLSEKVIRTPIPTMKSFRDDPLRIMRCIRFASRFQYKLSKEIVETIQNEDIKHEFAHKVSRERFGMELEKMLLGPHPYQSLSLIHSLGLYHIIFQAPSTIDTSEIPGSAQGIQLSETLDWVLRQSLTEPLKIDVEDRKCLFLAAALSPFKGMTIVEKKTRIVPVVQWIVRDSIKLKNHDIDCVTKFVNTSDSVSNVLNSPQSTWTRSALGMLVRTLGPKWRATFVLALTRELLPYHSNICSGSIADEITPILAKYQAALKLISELQLEECYQWKYLVDGKEVAKILQLRPGPQVKMLLEHVMIWQLDHPTATKEACLKFVSEELPKYL